MSLANFPHPAGLCSYMSLVCPSHFFRLHLSEWIQSTCPAAAWRSCLLSSFTATTSRTSTSKTTSYHCIKVFQLLTGEFLSPSLYSRSNRQVEKSYFPFLLCFFLMHSIAFSSILGGLKCIVWNFVGWIVKQEGHRWWDLLTILLKVLVQ